MSLYIACDLHEVLSAQGVTPFAILVFTYLDG